jgi:SAM-dependent methyltransferase
MHDTDITTGFQTVDKSDSEFLIRFIEDAHKIPAVAESFQTQLGILDLKPGYHVLDVGCGVGDRAADIAKIVGPEGRVVGTDISNAMIDASMSRHADSGLPLEFQIANATEQPFPDASFDRIRTERVLLYVKDTLGAFTEFRRLLKDDGMLMVVDFDFDAQVFAHKDKALTRRLVEYISDSFPQGRIGAELFGHFKDFGFCDVQVKGIAYVSPLEFAKRCFAGTIQSGVNDGVFDADEVATWWAALEQDDRDGRFFSAVEGYIVAGRK